VLESIATYCPSLRVFIIRYFALGAVTAIIFSPFISTLVELTLSGAVLAALAIFLVTPLIWGFLFDDHQKWLRHRRERWVLFPDRLRLHGSDGEVVDIALSEITHVSLWLWYSVGIRLRSGTKFRALYIPHASEMKRRINAQIAAQKGEAPHE